MSKCHCYRKKFYRLKIISCFSSFPIVSFHPYYRCHGSGHSKSLLNPCHCSIGTLDPPPPHELGVIKDTKSFLGVSLFMVPFTWDSLSTVFHWDAPFWLSGSHTSTRKRPLYSVSRSPPLLLLFLFLFS